ncbi:ABC transporter substrate-binding protein [Pigmentiphaga soli]|uniref:ABC transporter substrate-binding protein n=1 Tax=Pigmentiphaga soli TaxID=1007095 RepID=A0ABP8GYW6_9BURK
MPGQAFPLRSLFAGALLAFAAAGAHAAQQPVKVGVALDVSGPFSALGAETRDGIALAVKLLDGKLGGVPAEFLQTDMGGDPDQARQLADRWIRRDHIDLFTGPIGSNVALAVGPALFAAKVPYLSANAGPSQFAGKQCNAYFFGATYQNDTVHEAAGKLASDRGFKKTALIAPNYPAGKDALTGFKRLFTGTVGDELYTKLGQLDYAAELAQLRASKPDSLYFFLPGAMGINFIKQFVAAGLSKDITLIAPAFSADEDIIPAVGEPMLGLLNTSYWAHDLDNPANRKFVAEFRKAYKRYPSLYAAQGYDVIMAMDAAVRAVGGKVSDRPALLKALKAASYASVRGNFRYGNNQYPIQDYYVRVIGRDAQGVITNKLAGKVLEAHRDAYYKDCALK